jgi:hypothetical protein
MTEGGTYEALWKSARKGYVAWLVKRPKHQVTGADAGELIEQLGELAMELLGDCEPCIELAPPLPPAKSAASYFDPAWFRLGNNEGFHTAGETAPLYRKGLCSFCRAGLGGRTEMERVIGGRLKGDLGFVWNSLPGASIVSEGFLKFFRPLLGDALRAIPCRSEKPGKSPMWELELTGSLSFVCHRQTNYAVGVACSKCKTARYGSFVFEPIKKGLGYAVSRGDIERLQQPIAIVQTGESSDIIVAAELADKLRKSSRLKGILFDRVAILAEAEIGRFDVRKLRKSDVSG